MSNKIIIPIILILTTAGGFWTYTSLNTKRGDSGNSALPEVRTQPDASPATETGAVEETKAYTLEEIAGHATETDCWFAIDGKVYDVTQYIASNKHPGAKAIVEGCGKDATELFNTRPMGSGTPHSDKARSFLQSFEIGVLEKSE